MTRYTIAIPLKPVKKASTVSKLATAGLDRKIHVWDSSTGQMVLTLSGHQAEVNAIAFSPNSSLLASVGMEWRFIV